MAPISRARAMKRRKRAVRPAKGRRDPLRHDEVKMPMTGPMRTTPSLTSTCRRHEPGMERRPSMGRAERSPGRCPSPVTASGCRPRRTSSPRFSASQASAPALSRMRWPRVPRTSVASMPDPSMILESRLRARRRPRRRAARTRSPRTSKTRQVPGVRHGPAEREEDPPLGPGVEHLAEGLRVHLDEPDPPAAVHPQVEADLAQGAVEHFVQGFHDGLGRLVDAGPDPAASLAEAGAQHPAEAHGGASPAQAGGEPSLRCDADVDLGPLPRPAPVLLHQDPHVKGGAPYGGEAKVGLHDVALSPLDAGDALVERFEPAGLVLPSSPPPLVPSTEPP